MKIVRLATLVGFLVLTANIALADGAGDPRFQTIGGGHSIVLTSPTDPAFQVNYTAGVTPIVEGTCELGGTEGGSCFLVDFINNSGVTWSGIAITITGATGEITQDSFTGDNEADPYFASFAQTTNDLGQTVLSWFGIDETHPGILPSTGLVCGEFEDICHYGGPYLGDIPLFDFGILVNVSGATQTGDSFTSQGIATPVPEPKSIFLTLAGAALLGLYLSKRAA